MNTIRGNSTHWLFFDNVSKFISLILLSGTGRRSGHITSKLHSLQVFLLLWWPEWVISASDTEWTQRGVKTHTQAALPWTPVMARRNTPSSCLFLSAVRVIGSRAQQSIRELFFLSDNWVLVHMCVWEIVYVHFCELSSLTLTSQQAAEYKSIPTPSANLTCIHLHGCLVRNIHLLVRTGWSSSAEKAKQTKNVKSSCRVQTSIYFNIHTHEDAYKYNIDMWVWKWQNA